MKGKNLWCKGQIVPSDKFLENWDDIRWEGGGDTTCLSCKGKGYTDEHFMCMICNGEGKIKIGTVEI